ncbi:hypothetical protein GWK08_04090 [Leptobacterium flavescens]|uniref:Cytochrome c domain-containing protein n=1 Tax=Leptobacterium flavescens TaxID=472055 RepID=A0A6P0UL33_9FLAO|nr:cytochrome P460 family protein [Leptobacterium flavescens]NER12608.1 hypothetical protein [Leptobacterium flavescens]
MKNNFYKILILTGLLSFTSCKNANKSNKEYKNPTFFSINEGQLTRPTDYRSWVYVGSPLTPNDLNNGKAAFPEFHNVYIDPVSYEHWKEKGEWREGTILVKELVSVGTKSAASGNGYFMGEFIGLEATVKSKEHFPHEPGNWAYFSFTNPEGDLKSDARAFETNQCNSCHEANAGDDFVFTQHYPVLAVANSVGKDVIPENDPERTASSPPSIWDPTAPTPENLDIGIPLDKSELFAYLSSKKYRSFKTQEKEKHPSAGPHTKIGLPVKVFMNDIIAGSLDANNAEHPMGSTIVKEMFNADGDLAGWAVMAKTQEKTAEGNGWFWYEVTSVEDENSIAAMGNGVIGCISCHNIASKDMVRTAYPLK